MSLKWESMLISSIVDDSDIKPVIRAGVTVDDFGYAECRKVFRFIRKHYSNPRFGTVPSQDYIEERFDDFDFLNVTDDIKTIIERVREDRLYLDMQSLVTNITRTAQGEDAFAALEIAKARILSLSASQTRPELTDLTQEPEEVLTEYQAFKEAKGILGLSFPWDCLTKDTGGAEGGDLITIAGRPGTMKTWITQYILHHWHMNLDKKVIMFTKEMSKKALRRRLVSMFCEFDYGRFKSGQLTEAEEELLVDNLHAWKQCKPHKVMYVQSTGLRAIAEMQAIIEDEEPEAVAVDGFYFIGERNPETTALCTSRLKDLLMGWGIPAVINTQLNQQNELLKGAYGSTIGGGYGDAYAQDSTTFVKLRMTPESKQMQELELFPVKCREGIGRDFVTQAKPGGNFAQKYLVDDYSGDVEPEEDEDVAL